MKKVETAKVGDVPTSEKYHTLKNDIVMEYAIKVLLAEKDLLIEKLKLEQNTDVNKERVSHINKAVKWLNKISELKIKDVSNYEIVELPDMNTGYSEYRLMNDCETDDVNQWVEFKSQTGLTVGDIIISKKP